VAWSPRICWRIRYLPSDTILLDGGSASTSRLSYGPRRRALSIKLDRLRHPRRRLRLIPAGSCASKPDKNSCYCGEMICLGRLTTQQLPWTRLSLEPVALYPCQTSRGTVTSEHPIQGLWVKRLSSTKACEGFANAFISLAGLITPRHH
jgi:hypothetical protein